jgi:DNA-binding SARP family transcriptional activator/TolB-like protein
MNKMLLTLKQNDVIPVGSGGSCELRQRSSDRPIVRIHLLGPMRATSYLGDNVLPHGRRARAILGYLCLASGEQVPRAHLAALLWDRTSDAAARTSLRRALREVSSAFGALAKDLISIEQDSIKLNISACWIDALAVLALDPSALAPPTVDLNALCRGELLAGLDGASASFDRWLLGERTRVTERLQSLLERETEQAESKSDAYRGLARAAANMRERAQAPRGYARRRDAWQNVLETEPPSQTRAPIESGRARGDGESRDGHLTAPTILPQRSKQPIAHSRDRLRVGVLPFLANSSKNEENLALSLSQEIAAALARFRWFDVIAPMSLRPTESTRFLDERQLRSMDLGYVVDGTVSSNSKYIQISVRLMDLAEYARPVWSEHFELAVGELHRLNELVTARIVDSIDPIILFIEGQPKRREHYGATGLLLLAIPLIFSMERGKYKEAGRLIDRALDIEPDSAMVAAWAAYWHLFYAGQRWTLDIAQTRAVAQYHALRAIRLDPDNAEALGIYAHICSLVNKDFDTALYYFDRSLRLNPSLAFVWALSAVTYCYIGEPEIALQRLERYGELAPLDPYYFWFEHLYAIAYTFKGDYERAVIVGRRASKANPEFVAGYKPLIASLGHLGRCDEAKPYVAKLLSLEPNFTVERFGQVYPFKKDSDRKRYMQGLLLAGVPEC